MHQMPVADLDVAPRFIAIPESAAPVIQLPLLGGYLHAPTAAIVHQFCRIACHGEVLRVTHYEAAGVRLALSGWPRSRGGRAGRARVVRRSGGQAVSGRSAGLTGAGSAEEPVR